MMSRGSSRRSWMRHRPTPRSVGSARPRRRDRDEPLAGMIEVEIDGVTVRVGRGAAARTIAAVMRALKAGA